MSFPQPVYCTRCKKVAGIDDCERCYPCFAPLCSACWDMYGSCQSCNPFCPRHGRKSRPAEVPGLRCDCVKT